MAELNDGIWLRFKADVEGAFDKIEEIPAKVKGIAGEMKGSFEGVVDSWKSGLGDIPALVETMGAGMTTAIAAPIAAIAAAALAVGTELDEVFDHLRARTGETGEGLDKLSESFRQVFVGVPDSAGKVSEALAFLSQRTHTTGEDLEKLTKSMLDLSRLSGESLKPLMEGTTRLFGEWKVSTDQQTESLDKLLVVSQKTGVGVTTIADALTKFGPALQELGMNLDQSSALFAKLESSGQNAAKMFAGLKTAATNFAANGMDAQEGWGKFIDSIKAADDQTALLIAKQVVGKQSAADWAQAIKSGAVNVDDLVASLGEASGAIESGIQDTEDFAESWAKFKNQITLALEPLGKVVFGLMNDIVEAMEPVVNIIAAVVKSFGTLEPATQKIIVVVALLIAAILPLTTLFGVTLLGALTAVGYAVAAVAAAWALWKVGEWLYQFAPVKAAVDAVVTSLRELWGWLSNLPGVKDVLGGISDMWDKVKTAAGGAVQEVKGFNQVTGEFLPEGVGQTKQWATEVDKLGKGFKGAGGDVDFFGKNARAAASDLEKAIVSMENSTEKLLLTLPQTQREFDHLASSGKNTQQMIDALDKKLKEIAFNFGDALPPRIQALADKLTYAKNAMISWKKEMDELHLETAFQKINTGLFEQTAKWLENNRKEVELLVQTSLAGFDEAAKRVQSYDESFRQLGVTTIASLERLAQAATVNLYNVITAFDAGFAKELDVSRAIAAQIQVEINLRKAQGQSVDELVEKLARVKDNIAAATQSSMTLGEALRTVGVPSMEALRDKAEAAQKALEKIAEAVDKGKASAIQFQQAEIAALQAQVAAAAESGASYDSLNAKLIAARENLRLAQSAQTGWETALTNFGVTANKILENDLPNNLTKSVMSMKGFGQAVEDVGKKLLEQFINTVLKELFKNLNILDLNFTSLGASVKKFGETLTSVFGGAAQSSSNIVNQGGYMMGSGGGAGGAGSAGSSGSLGGVAGAINVVTGAISAISGIIGNFQNARQEKTLNAIEESTRYMKSYLRDNIIPDEQKYWPNLDKLAQLLRLEGIEEGIKDLVEGGNANAIATAIGAAVTDALTGIAKGISDAVEGLASMFETQVEGAFKSMAYLLQEPLFQVAAEVQSFHNEAVPLLRQIAGGSGSTINAPNASINIDSQNLTRISETLSVMLDVLQTDIAYDTRSIEQGVFKVADLSEAFMRSWGDFTHQVVVFLQSIAESNIALYNGIMKLGNGVDYLARNSVNRSGGNTFNVNVIGNSSNPYTQGQQTASGIMNALGGHL